MFFKHHEFFFQSSEIIMSFIGVCQEDMFFSGIVPLWLRRMYTFLTQPINSSLCMKEKSFSYQLIDSHIISCTKTNPNTLYNVHLDVWVTSKWTLPKHIISSSTSLRKPNMRCKWSPLVHLRMQLAVARTKQGPYARTQSYSST